MASTTGSSKGKGILAPDTVLAVESLSVRLPIDGERVFGVEDVSFTVKAGSIRCLVGESGSGKSLTAQSVLGLLPRRFTSPQGSIRFEEVNIIDLGPGELRRIRGNRIGMIFQEPMTALNPIWKIGDQIEEVLLTHTAMNQAQRRDRIREIMTEVNLPDASLLGRYPHELSGGQRQRVMIAMALICEPRLLIADEPTTALDVTTQAQILKLIRQLQIRHGMGVLFITHDFGVVEEIADEVAVMKDGRIVEEGAAASILGDPQHGYTKALLAAVPRGRFAAPREAKGAAPVLKVEWLSKTYRSGGLFSGSRRAFRALEDVTFEVGRNEIVGLVGESGSGKSTVARCISRLVPADAGRITIEDVELSTLRGEALRQVRRNLQVVFQDPYSSLNPRRSIRQIIAQGPMNFGMSKEQAVRKAGDLLEMVGLERSALGRYPSDFSGGQRQRIGLARALALEPKLLIADEAVSALDVSVQAQVLQLIRDTRERLGIAVLFITHDLRVAAELCDRVVVLKDGRVVEQGSCRDVLTAPRDDYTRLLIAAVPGRRWSESP